MEEEEGGDKGDRLEDDRDKYEYNNNDDNGDGKTD